MPLTPRPMGNAFDQQRQYQQGLPSGPSAHAGLFTTNASGAQTTSQAITRAASSPIIQNQLNAMAPQTQRALTDRDKRAQAVLGSTGTSGQVLYDLQNASQRRREGFEALQKADAQAASEAQSRLSSYWAGANQQSQHNLQMGQLAQRADAVLGSQGFADGQAGAASGSDLAALIAARNNTIANQNFDMSPGHSLAKRFGPRGGVEGPPQLGPGQKSMRNPAWTPGSSESKYITYGAHSPEDVAQMRQDNSQRQYDSAIIRVTEDGRELQPGQNGYDDAYPIARRDLANKASLARAVGIQKQRRKRKDVQRSVNGGLTDAQVRKVERKRTRLSRKVDSGLMTQGGANSLLQSQIAQDSGLNRPVGAKADNLVTLPGGNASIETQRTILADKEAMKDDAPHAYVMSTLGVEDSTDPDQLKNVLKSSDVTEWFANSEISDDDKYSVAKEYARALRSAYNDDMSAFSYGISGNSNFQMNVDQLMSINLDDQGAVMQWMRGAIDRHKSTSSAKSRIDRSTGGLSNWLLPTF